MSAKVTMITGTLMGDYERAVQDDMLEHIEDIKDQIAHDAEFYQEEDNGDEVMTIFENFYSECHANAEDYLGKLIESQHVDLSDDEYDMLKSWLGDWLADELASFEQECIAEFEKSLNTKKKPVKKVFERRVSELEGIKTLGDLTSYVREFKNTYDVETFAKDNDIWIRLTSKD